MVKGNFETLKVSQNIISLFASGTSILELTDQDFSLLKEKTFTIGTNYCYKKFVPHLLAWGDSKLTLQVEKDLPSCLYTTREQAFKRNMKDNFKSKINYWYNPSSYHIIGNFTSFWILQLLKRFFSDKKILLFGFDFYANENEVKWVDQYTDLDKSTRNTYSYIKPTGTLNKFYNSMCTWANSNVNIPKNIVNCSLKSRFEYFEKKNWKECV